MEQQSPAVQTRAAVPHSHRALRYFEKKLPWSDPALLWPAAMNSFAPLVERFQLKGKATEIRMRRKIVVK
jgi:hypothetical protein